MDQVEVGYKLDRRVADAHAAYAAARPRSRAAHERARTVLPGGNTRSVLHFEPFPFRVERAEGNTMIDIDGHRYVDFCGNYSAGLLGHSPGRIRAAVVEALDRGWALGAVHERETELAELLCGRFPSLDRVRFTNSGTEANLMAIGTAIDFTGRPGVVVFDHAYHGGVLSFGASPDADHGRLNVPHDIRVGRFNDVESLDRLITADVGCVVVEPVQGSGGCRPASVQFLVELRDRCRQRGSVLIFDEVMTSRLAPGGAQERFDIVPDMTTLGKYLAGGMTFGAFGGRAEIMDRFDPERGGRLAQAGTFNNNVVTISAALANLRHELDSGMLADVNARGEYLRDALNHRFGQASAYGANAVGPVEGPSGPALWATGIGSMVAVHSADDRVLELYFHAMLGQGLYLARRGFMALSAVIGDAEVQRLLTATELWCVGDE